MNRSNLIRRVKDDLRLDAENNVIAWIGGAVVAAMFILGAA